jgi:hypothetical protein
MRNNELPVVSSREELSASRQMAVRYSSAFIPSSRSCIARKRCRSLEASRVAREKGWKFAPAKKTGDEQWNGQLSNYVNNIALSEIRCGEKNVYFCRYSSGYYSILSLDS